MEPVQGTLLGAEVPGVTGTRVERVTLDATAWVDVARGWLTGAETLLEDLAARVPWRQGRRRMFDQIVDEPRLSFGYGARDRLPHPVLDDVRAALASHYDARFGSVFLNYYRDGRDSVAWHGDRELRSLDDTRVAILTLGSARPFLLRSRAGGPSHDLRPGSGDLLVMGGRCQRDWEHAVPKVARCGPRISVSLRWSSRVVHDKRAASSSAASGSQARVLSRHARAASSSTS